MKLMICGKGGSGKSTVAAILAKQMARLGRRILLVDVDESNIGLYRMLGMEMPQTLMESFGGKKGFNERARSSGIGLGGTASSALFPDKMRIDELPPDCLAHRDGIYAVSVGKIHHFGEGCACPMGRLFRMLFSSLVIEENDVAIVDTTAGVEHFGRSLDNQCDRILCVIDPSYESIVLARKVKQLAGQINLDPAFVTNKMTAEVKTQLAEELEGMNVIGAIDNDPKVFLDTLKGRAIDVDTPQSAQICNALLKKE